MNPIAQIGISEMIDPRALETQLERQPMQPGVAAGPAQLDRLALPLADDRARAFDHEHRADPAQQQDVGQADGDVELSQPAQQGEQRDAGNGPEHAAHQQHHRERQVDRVPPPIADGAGKRRRRDMARDRGHRHRRGYAEEDQQRRHQEPAADAEHAGNESDRDAEAEDHEDIDRQFRDREVELHGRGFRRFER